MEITFDIRFYLDSTIKTLLINNGKNILLKLKSGVGWKFSSSLDKINIASNRNININNQPITNEHIHLTGETKELITVVRWSLKKY